MKENDASLNRRDHKSLKRYIRSFILFFLISLLAFGLGRLSIIEERKTPVTIEYDLNLLPEDLRDQDVLFKEEIPKNIGAVVGSKNGTVYHLPWCPGAQQMNEENKIWFASVKVAEEEGYQPAKNCKGI